MNIERFVDNLLDTMVAMAEPCPFCGQRPQYQHTRDLYTELHQVYLTCPSSCSRPIRVGTSFQFGKHYKLETLLEMWNQTCLEIQPPVSIDELETLYGCE